MYQFEINKNVRAFPIIWLVVVIGFTVIILADRNADVVFQFPEYDYKDTSKNVGRNFECLSICSKTLYR